MRTIEKINRDIERCQGQIAATFEQHSPQNAKDILIVREAFQQTLKNLLDEKQMHGIDVAGATVVHPSGAETQIGSSGFMARAAQAVHRTIQDVQKPAICA